MFVLRDRVEGALFDVKARSGDPSLPLIGVGPSGDSARRVGQSAVDAFNDVRGSEPIAQLLGDPEFVERERFLQALLQTGRGLRIMGIQGGHQGVQFFFCLDIGVSRIGRFKFFLICPAKSRSAIFEVTFSRLCH